MAFSKHEMSFGDRSKAAALAKQAALEKFHARAKAVDPVDAARRAALAQARDEKRAAAEAARRARHENAKAERLAAAEAAVREAAAAAEAEAAAIEAERLQRIQAAAQLLAEQKAARDRRYAARKARK